MPSYRPRDGLGCGERRATVDHAVNAAEAWATTGPPLPLATASLWHLGQQLGKP